VEIGIENEGESMPGTRRSYAPSLKAKVAIEAIKGNRTAAQIAQTFSVHPNLVAFWKKQAIDHLPEVFSAGQGKQKSDVERDQLFEQIGRLKVELDFLKKRAGMLD
jgi:transposase-like protein